MLYIIGGASRSGKTIIAEELSVKMKIPYLSLDWIMMGFTNGIPEYGIHDLLFPDDIAERLWSFLKAMLESMIFAKTNCIIEGEAILPELIIELLKDYPEEIKICFLGYSNVNIDQKVNEIRSFSKKENDWLLDKSDAYVVDHVKNMITHSKLIRKSCIKVGLPYFNISKSFTNQIEGVKNYMLNTV